MGLQPGENLRGYRVTDQYGRRMYVVVNPNSVPDTKDQLGMDTISDSDGREQLTLVTEDGTSLLELITSGVDLTQVISPDELDTALLGYVPQPDFQQEGYLSLQRNGSTAWSVLPPSYVPDSLDLGNLGPTETITMTAGQPMARKAILDQNAIVTVNPQDLGTLHLLLYQSGSKTLSIIDALGGTANLIDDVPTSAGWFSLDLEGTGTGIVYGAVKVLSLINEPPPPPAPEVSNLDVQYAASVPGSLSNNVVFVRNDGLAMALSNVAGTNVTAGTDVQAFNLGKNSVHLHKGTNIDAFVTQPGVAVYDLAHDAAAPTSLPANTIVRVVDKSGGPTGKYFFGD